jgi:hypothetical protein
LHALLNVLDQTPVRIDEVPMKVSSTSPHRGREALHPGQKVYEVGDRTGDIPGIPTY